MVTTRSAKRKAQSANAVASKTTKRNAPKRRNAPKPSAAKKKRHHQLDVSDDESVLVDSNVSNSNNYSSSNEHPLILVTPRDNCFNDKTWWLVDLSPIQGTSLQGASALVKRCMRTQGWNETKTRKVLGAYRQFLLLKKIHEDWDAEKFSPCYLVDQMWHCHILDVVNYCHDMMLLCGQVLGHNPDGALDIMAKRKRDRDTRASLREEFGMYDEEVWDYSPDVSISSAPSSTGARGRRPELSSEISSFTFTHQDGRRHYVRMGKSTPMTTAFDAYSAKIGIDVGHLRFLLDGERVSENSTPESLKLHDGVRIDVFLPQCGC